MLLATRMHDAMTLYSHVYCISIKTPIFVRDEEIMLQYILFSLKYF